MVMIINLIIIIVYCNAGDGTNDNGNSDWDGEIITNDNVKDWIENQEFNDWDVFNPKESTIFLKIFVWWLHHVDFNEMPGEKTKCELYKNDICCFKQILEAAPHKTAAVRPLTYHWLNHPNKMSKTVWVLLGK